MDGRCWQAVGRGRLPSDVERERVAVDRVGMVVGDDPKGAGP